MKRWTRRQRRSKRRSRKRNTPYKSHIRGGGNKDLCFYTCFFGPVGGKGDTIPSCPSKTRDCYYFTNNKETFEKAKATGSWKAVFVDIPIKNSDRDNSMDAKGPKACPHRYKELDGYEYTMYFDSTRNVSEEEVLNAMNSLKALPDVVMVLRRHYMIRDSVWREFEEAMTQERYRQDRDKYKAYIEEMLRNPKLKDHSGRHFETNLILRKMGEKAKEIGEKWYADIQRTGPECQISFAFIQQLYPKEIGILGETTPAIQAGGRRFANYAAINSMSCSRSPV